MFEKCGNNFYFPHLTDQHSNTSKKQNRLVSKKQKQFRLHYRLTETVTITDHYCLHVSSDNSSQSYPAAPIPFYFFFANHIDELNRFYRPKKITPVYRQYINRYPANEPLNLLSELWKAAALLRAGSTHFRPTALRVCKDEIRQREGMAPGAARSYGMAPGATSPRYREKTVEMF